MKKLMIAAAVAAMTSGLYAACGEVTPAAELLSVYQFKASLKTTKGVLAMGAKGGDCGEAAGCKIYRTKDSMSLSGWLYATDDCTCNGWTANACVWDTKRKCELTGAAFTFGLANDNPNVMGKKNTEAEAFWTLVGQFAYNANQAQDITALYGAGLGSFNKSSKTYKFSGYCAGTMTASFDLKNGAENCCFGSQTYECDNLVDPQDGDTVAYGSWSLKYNASATKKWSNNAFLKVPDYVVSPAR